MEANMPTSVISEEALEAGRRFDIYGVGSKRSAVQKPGAPKLKPQGGRRGRKPKLDPSKGFALSNQAADRLIASGFVKESIPAGAAVPSPSTSLVANSSILSNGIPVSEHSLFVPGQGIRPNQISPSQEISNAAASLQALAQDHGIRENASATTLAPKGTTLVAERKEPAFEWNADDTGEESNFDDPNDASFGSRSSGRKKGKPQKTTGLAKKRKSAAPGGPTKRSRLSLNGGVDGAADVACAASQDTPS